MNTEKSESPIMEIENIQEVINEIHIQEKTNGFNSKEEPQVNQLFDEYLIDVETGNIQELSEKFIEDLENIKEGTSEVKRSRVSSYIKKLCVDLIQKNNIPTTWSVILHNCSKNMSKVLRPTEVNTIPTEDENININIKEMIEFIRFCLNNENEHLELFGLYCICGFRGEEIHNSIEITELKEKSIMVNGILKKYDENEIFERNILLIEPSQFEEMHEKLKNLVSFNNENKTLRSDQKKEISDHVKEYLENYDQIFEKFHRSTRAIYALINENLNNTEKLNKMQYMQMSLNESKVVLNYDLYRETNDNVLEFTEKYNLYEEKKQFQLRLLQEEEKLNDEKIIEQKNLNELKQQQLKEINEEKQRQLEEINEEKQEIQENNEQFLKEIIDEEKQFYEQTINEIKKENIEQINEIKKENIEQINEIKKENTEQKQFYEQTINEIKKENTEQKQFYEQTINEIKKENIEQKQFYEQTINEIKKENIEHKEIHEQTINEIKKENIEHKEIHEQSIDEIKKFLMKNIDEEFIEEKQSINTCEKIIDDQKQESLQNEIETINEHKEMLSQIKTEFKNEIIQEIQHLKQQQDQFEENEEKIIEHIKKPKKQRKIKDSSEEDAQQE